MSAVSKSYTFTPGTDIESAEVNQNFDDLVNYTNSEVIVRDASKAFTAIPSGPGTDPTSPNQFARKQYVDNQDTTITSSVTALTTTVSGHTTDLTKRPTINNNATGLKIVSDSVVVTTDANGDAQVTFPNAFTNCVSVIATSGALNAAAIPISTISLFGFTNSAFTFRVYRITSLSALGAIALEPSVSAGVRVNYIAIGT